MTNMDYCQDHILSEIKQELRIYSFIVVTYSNMSNFIVNVIYDMQVSRLIPTAAQQTMDFLSHYWANMCQTKDIVDLIRNTNQPF